MSDPIGTVGASKSESSDLSLVMQGGANFLRRMQALSDLLEQQEKAFERLNLGTDAQAALDAASIPFLEAEVTMLPQSTADLKGKEAEQMVRLMDSLEDCDDVQKVYTNADIPEEVAERA